MPKRNRKRPKTVETPGPSKVPTWASRPTLEGSPLVWLFINADVTGPYPPSTTWDSTARRVMIDKLPVFERMDTSSFLGICHRHPTRGLDREAVQRLRKIKLDDMELLYSLPMSGIGRLWCMKHTNMMSVLWWDPEHKVFPVSKKRT